MNNGEQSSLLALFGVGLAVVIYSAGNPAQPWHPWDSVVGLSLLFMILSVKVPNSLAPLLAYGAILSISIITSIGILVEIAFGESQWLATELADYCPGDVNLLDCPNIRRWDVLEFSTWAAIALMVVVATKWRQHRNSKGSPQ